MAARPALAPDRRREGEGGQHRRPLHRGPLGAEPADRHGGPRDGHGSAKAPTDLTATTGTLTISFGETSKTVEVAIRSDGRNERNETFFVDLSNTSTTVSDASGKGTISSRARSTRTGGSSSVVTEDRAYRMVRDTAPPEVRFLFAGIRKESDKKVAYAPLTKTMR